jgi:four helix bundle protein
MFETLERSLEMVGAVRRPYALVRKHDRDLADQIKRAANSAPANIAEGAGRVGKDRPHLYRIAAGSVLELETHLRVALIWDYVQLADVQPALDLCRRVSAMLSRLTPR